MKKISLADQIGNVSSLMAVTAITVYLLSFFATLVIAPQCDAIDARSLMKCLLAGLAAFARLISPASAGKSSLPAPASQ